MNISIAKSVIFAAVTIAALIQACTPLQEAARSLRPEPAASAAQEEELALIRDTIEDADRLEHFLGLIAERDRLVQRYSVEVETHRSRMTALNADFRSQRGDFEALLADYNRKRADSQRELVELIHAMKQTTTPEEWKDIARFQIKRLPLRHLTYDAGNPGG